jgi:hypothetical protein
MNPQFRPGDRVRVRLERGFELTGTVVSYLSGELFVVEIEGERFPFPQNVRARDMRRIEDDEDTAPEDEP